MTGRHAAADEADDETRAATQPAPQGAHRADAAPQAATPEPVPAKRAGRRRAPQPGES